MRRMIMLLTASALMVMMWAVPASAEIIIEPGLTVSEGGVVVEHSTVCNALAGTAGFGGRVALSPPNNPFPPTLSSPNNPFPPTLVDGEVCWLELPGWDAAAAVLAAGSTSDPFPPGLISAPKNPFPPT
jgi:hypothetical protein